MRWWLCEGVSISDLDTCKFASRQLKIRYALLNTHCTPASPEGSTCRKLCLTRQAASLVGLARLGVSTFRLSALGGLGAAKKSRGFSIVSGDIVHTTDAAFEQDVVKSAQPVLLDFWAEWCGPCKMIAPLLDTIATEYKDKLRVVKLNIDENPKTPPKFNIRGIPTLLLFRNGTVAAQQVGAVSKAQLESFLEKHLNGQHTQANKTA